MNAKIFRLVGLGLVLLVSGCSGKGPTPLTTLPSHTDLSPTATRVSSLPTSTPEPEIVPSPTVERLPEALGLDPQDWMNWPILPIITQDIVRTYEIGQALGRNPQAFSIFGDCQSEPEHFLGLYEEDESAYSQLPPTLQETVDYFAGSLNRKSPTTKSGTTTGALMWIKWHEGKHGCQNTESPAECEVRIHNPAFVVFAIGTHYESRNEQYMRILIEDLIAQGVVPILSTKADNREGDHSINLQTAQLAAEYYLPLWNFWAVTADLPDNGLVIRRGEERLGKIYFNEEVTQRHRISALEMLDMMWRTIEKQ